MWRIARLALIASKSASERLQDIVLFAVDNTENVAIIYGERILKTYTL
jgi:hypothetical protein